MNDAFSMRRWADWLVGSTTDLGDGEQRWLALFLFRQLLQGRQFIESARTTGDALPQMTLTMPKPEEMDYLREVQAFADFIVPGQLVGETLEPAERRAIALKVLGQQTPALQAVTERWIAGEIDTEDYLFESTVILEAEDERHTPPPKTPAERWTAGLISSDEMNAEMHRLGLVHKNDADPQTAQRRLEVRGLVECMLDAGDAVSDETMDILNAYIRGVISADALARRLKGSRDVLE